MAQSLGSMPWTVGRRLRFLGCKMGHEVLSGTFGQLPCGEWVSGRVPPGARGGGQLVGGARGCIRAVSCLGTGARSTPHPLPTPAPAPGFRGSEGLLEAGNPHAGSVSRGDGLAIWAALG